MEKRADLFFFFLLSESAELGAEVEEFRGGQVIVKVGILREVTVNFPPVEATPEPTTVQPAGTGPGPETSEGLAHRKHHPEASRNEMLRVLVNFPRFVGPDLRNYGPFEREDVIALPDEVSEILLARKVGERIRPAGEGP